MSRSYRLTPEAQAQFVAIGEFVAQDSIEAALNLYDALEGAFEQLAAMPEMGHVREDLTERPVKFWSVFSYLVIYDPASDPLSIIAIVHGARDVESVLKNQ
ncbi:MAG: type II toxin-antitoxin system RelE/ParE family toxin [Acidobacteria bacterium]|nr:type II toxin-antitoxin system RelE/ParE family toxin [Acidobacteriota bacterium]